MKRLRSTHIVTRTCKSTWLVLTRSAHAIGIAIFDRIETTGKTSHCVVSIAVSVDARRSQH